MMHNRAPTKKKDPRSFTIPCTIGNHYVGKALCDQLANRSYVQPEGKSKDILVRVDKFIFLADFLILDCEANEHAPIILGRPFLAIGRIMIDCEKGELVIRVNDQHEKINVFAAVKQPENTDAKMIRAINLDVAISCLGMHHLKNYMMNPDPGDGVLCEQIKYKSKSKTGQKRRLKIKRLKIFHKGKTKRLLE
ncbi:hypothetical protein V6N13_037468 [Hibiscus sabdariffa]